MKYLTLLSKAWFIIPIMLISFVLGAFIAKEERRGHDSGYAYGYLMGQRDFAIELTNEIGLKIDASDFDKAKYKPYRQIMDVKLYVYKGEKLKSFAIAD